MVKTLRPPTPSYFVPFNPPHLNVSQKLVQIFEIASDECFCVYKVYRIIFLAIGTDVLVDEFSLAGQDSDALSMEPVLAFVTADVESIKSFA